MADKRFSDNVVAFQKVMRNTATKKKSPRVNRYRKPKLQFPHHDKVVRLSVRGRVQTDTFIRWVVEEAARLQLDGWARCESGGPMDMLIAGGQGDVCQMVEALTIGPRPLDMVFAREVPLKGNEPMWSGFHYLSPR